MNFLDNDDLFILDELEEEENEEDCDELDDESDDECDDEILSDYSQESENSSVYKINRQKSSGNGSRTAKYSDTNPFEFANPFETDEKNKKD